MVRGWLSIRLSMINVNFFQRSAAVVVVVVSQNKILKWDLLKSPEFVQFSRIVYFVPKWVRLAPDGTNTGIFQIRFQYILAQ